MNQTGFHNLLIALGIDPGQLVAGFAGGIASLNFLKGLTKTQMLVSVFSSLACAVYGTPLAAKYFGITDNGTCYGLAFALGLCAMNVLPMVRAMVEKKGTQLADTSPPTYGGGDAKP
jgi:hypothetical protein